MTIERFHDQFHESMWPVRLSNQASQNLESYCRPAHLKVGSSVLNVS